MHYSHHQCSMLTYRLNVKLLPFSYMLFFSHSHHPSFFGVDGLHYTSVARLAEAMSKFTNPEIRKAGTSRRRKAQAMSHFCLFGDALPGLFLPCKMARTSEVWGRLTLAVTLVSVVTFVCHVRVTDPFDSRCVATAQPGRLRKCHSPSCAGPGGSSKLCDGGRRIVFQTPRTALRGC